MKSSLKIIIMKNKLENNETNYLVELLQSLIVFI